MHFSQPHGQFVVFDIFGGLVIRAKLTNGLEHDS